MLVLMMIGIKHIGDGRKPAANSDAFGFMGRYGCRPFEMSADQGAFCHIAGGHIFRTVTEPDKKEDTPDQAEKSQNQKGLLPAEKESEPANDDRGHGPAETGESPDDALSQAALLKGKPAANDAGHVWIGSGLAATEQEPDQHHEHQEDRQVPPEDIQVIVARS